ncbi:MAG: tetratricopeptide repeat protein [Leptolyngbya sp. RL_3_1]|nr:tetratricopeptide repeat protein [Leptolyngbya sp. RL_3_1]
MGAAGPGAAPFAELPSGGRELRPSPCPRPGSGQTWYCQGLSAYYLNDLKTAIAAFETALSHQPHHREAQLALGYALTKAGQHAKALECLATPLAEGWADARLYACSAYLLRHQGKPTEALQQLYQAVRLDPENAQIWFQKGLTLANLSRYEEAQTAISESLKRQAYSANGWLAMGLTLRHLSDYDSAVEAFNKALSITPDQPLAFFQQACCYAALDRPDWAIEHLRRAIALDAAKYIPRVSQEPALQALPRQALRPVLGAAS